MLLRFGNDGFLLLRLCPLHRHSVDFFANGKVSIRRVSRVGSFEMTHGADQKLRTSAWKRVTPIDSISFLCQELCERHEKGVLKDHQHSLQKMQQIKKRQIAAQAKGQDHAVDQLESKIVEQETDISNMENRNYFSLHCLQLETQLVHANMKLLAIVLQKMVTSQIAGHKEVRCKLDNKFPNTVGNKLS